MSLNPLAIATDGYLTGTGLQPVSMATSGYIVVAVPVTYTIGSGGSKGRKKRVVDLGEYGLPPESKKIVPEQDFDDDVEFITFMVFTLMRN